MKTAQADIYSQHGAEDERPIFSYKTKHPPTCLVKPYSFDSVLSQVTSVMVCDCVRVCAVRVWSRTATHRSARVHGALLYVAGCARRPAPRPPRTGTAHTLTGLRRAGDLRCVFSHTLLKVKLTFRFSCCSAPVASAWLGSRCCPARTVRAVRDLTSVWTGVTSRRTCAFSGQCA